MDPSIGTKDTASSLRPDGTLSPEQVVREFLGALERFDVERATELLDPAVTYQNVPFPPARGRDAVAKQLQGFEHYCSAFEVIHHNIATDGNVVLTERTDIITVGKVPGAFWVCGTFEVHDGRITVWRDRFDFIDFTWSFVRGGVQALLGRTPGRRSTAT
ncbi:MAG: limonene-1,2-epoxide hydrolase family protein [Aquihabitans sp.]